MNSTNLETISSFVSALLSRYRELLPADSRRLSLVYGEGLLKAQLQLDEALPKHIVVIGPTQVGKSTVVNLLLGGKHAKSSALAGYTRHAQGFTGREIDSILNAHLGRQLPQLKSVPLTELSADDLDSYSISRIQANKEENRVVWDTPDFDSVSSRDYRTTVPTLCALADLVVLVVSKEKYADQSVWEILRLIGKTCGSLVVAINKTTEDAAEPLIQAMQNKFEQESLPFNAIVALPYMADNQTDVFSDSPSATDFRHQASEALSHQKARISPEQVQLFLNQYWPDWIEPLQLEHVAANQWRNVVEEAMAESLQQFERDYLKNPSYRETLDQAIVQLLSLLEIPGMAEPLAKVRHVLTWPARTAINWAKKTKGISDQRPQETIILEEIVQQLLIKLQRSCGEKAARTTGGEQLWWRQLWDYMHQQQEGLTLHGNRLIDDQHRLFQPQIEVAADELYEHLKAHPATLNALRATRAGIDTAAIALAIKTGGLGLHDLLLTPAMLSISTMLTEGAVGQYMSSVENELKEAKKVSVDEHLMVPLADHLMGMHSHMSDKGLFGLTEQQLKNTEQAIKELT